VEKKSALKADGWVVGAQHAAPLRGNQPSTRHSERSEESASSASRATRHSPLATFDFAREFSSSEYSKTIGNIVAGTPPAIDLAAENRLIKFLVTAAAEGLVESCHDISDGGLAVALAESCFSFSPIGAQHAGPHLGAVVNLDDASLPAEHTIFNERGARAIISVKPTLLAGLLESARQYNVVAQSVGQVTRAPGFRIELKGRAVIDSPLESLRDAWADSLERTLVGPPAEICGSRLQPRH
jgi:phosphoribosylformylglycinamidine (FGAM) synthase-like enzyme